MVIEIKAYKDLANNNITKMVNIGVAYSIRTMDAIIEVFMEELINFAPEENCS